MRLLSNSKQKLQVQLVLMRQQVQPKLPSLQPTTTAIQMIHEMVSFTLRFFLLLCSLSWSFSFPLQCKTEKKNSCNEFSEGVIISSKTNEFERLSYSTEENYPRSNYPERSTENVRYEAMVTSPMSITMKTDSSAIINGPAHQTNNPLPSHQMSSAVVYKPIQSVIQSTNSSGNNISTPMSAPSESSFQLNSRSNANGDYLKDSSASHQNQYFVLRSSADGSTINNSQPSVYRERSIEETEAAHDLLSLSQSLPPLPAPCVVTILHPVTNYNVNSPDVQEITPSRPSNEYITNITYTSGRNTQNHSDRTERTERTERIETHARNKKNVSTQFDADMLPDDSSSSGKFVSHNQLSPFFMLDIFLLVIANLLIRLKRLPDTQM